MPLDSEDRLLLAKQRGGTLVEASIVLPLVVLLLLGVVQWGVIFGAQLTLRSAATAAARFAVLGDAQPNNNEVEEFARQSVQPMLDPTRVNANISTQTIGATDAFKVSVSYDMEIFFPLVVPDNNDGHVMLAASTIMR